MAGEKSKKISKKMLFAWPTRTISTSVAACLGTYITFFATDYLGVSAVTVGLVFMVSKVFDGVTDLIAGYIIDRSHFKLGKGRPFDLALIGYWVSLVLLFAAPQMGITPTIIYLFIIYTLINSVFLTFLSCNEPAYLANAVEEPDHVVTLSAVTGFISLVFTMIASIILPTVIDTIGTTRQGWALIAVVMAVPFTLIGLLRFFLVAERKEARAAAAAAQRISAKDMINCIAKNKYILIFAIVILISNFGTTMCTNVQTYYFEYIMGDLSLASIMSLSMLSIIIIMVLVPSLSKKFGFVNVMRATTLIGMLGYLVRLAAPRNMIMLFGSNIFAMMGFYTMFAFASTFVIDCIDYGEWKSGVRSEGAISCVTGFTGKIGTAAGSGCLGVLMGLAGYNGALEVQSGPVNMVIIMLFTVVPAAGCLVQFILLRAFDLDKKIDGIRAELKQRKGEVQ